MNTDIACPDPHTSGATGHVRGTAGPGGLPAEVPGTVPSPEGAGFAPQHPVPSSGRHLGRRSDRLVRAAGSAR